jgi:hypothetical protein
MMPRSKRKQKPDGAVAYGVKWHKLSFPKPWKPDEDGEELIGYYLGQTTYDGQFGQYNVVMLAVPTGKGYSQPYTASGSALLRAIDGGQVERGQLVRVTFQGHKDLGDDRYMKRFDVYIGEGGHLDDQTAELLYDRLVNGDYGDGKVPAQEEPMLKKTGLRARTLRQTCPKCGAEPEVLCVNKDGTKAKILHIERARAGSEAEG